jgi:hypothetical protein
VDVIESTAAQRGQLLQNLLTIEQLRRPLSPEPENPCTARAVRNLVDRLWVPFVKVLGVRYYDIDVVRAAILAHPAVSRAQGRRAAIPPIAA